jgi:polygalacturonase
VAVTGVPVAERVYGAGHYLRPQFVQPYRCTNVLVEGVTITNSPMRVIHPVLSRNVVVRGVTVVSAGPNNDGCDPESSTDVLIENVFVREATGLSVRDSVFHDVAEGSRLEHAAELVLRNVVLEPAATREERR